MKHLAISISRWAFCQRLRVRCSCPLPFSVSFYELQVLTLILQDEPSQSHVIIYSNGPGEKGVGDGVR